MSQHIGRPCHVYWKDEEEWFDGVIDDYHAGRGWHCQYYDGDDEWLPKLDPSVIRFDDNNEAATSEGLGATLASTGRSRRDEGDDDEVLIVDQEDERAANTDEDDQSPALRLDDEGEEKDGLDDKGGDDDEDNDVFSATIFDLPDRGVLLLGSVTGASNLPASASEGGGEVFFRVLYVEGGSSSTMFRCKTPIFTSPAAEDPFFPAWQGGSFRFEMVAPAAPAAEEAASRRPSTTGRADKFRMAAIQEDEASSFRLVGEILVALYRQRPLGGSDYIGQITVDLQEFARSGTPEVYKEGIEARSMRGSFPLVSRSGGTDGPGGALSLAHVDLSLELAWRSDTESMLPIFGRSGGGGGGLGSSGASYAGSRASTAAGGGRKQPGRSGGSTTSSQGTSRGAGSSSSASEKQQPSGAASVARKAPAPRQLSSSSNALRRNRTEQLRIERENKALQNRLLAQKSKHPTNHKSIQKADDVYAIDAAPKKSAEEEAGVDPKFARQVRGMSQADLMDMFYAMKRDVALREKRVKDCRATNSRLNLQAVKYASAIDKLRKGASAVPAAAEAKKADSSSSLRASASKLGADSKHDDDAGNGGNCASAVAEDKASSGGGGEAMPERKDDDADSIDDVRDKELKELLYEHRALQEVRRGLVDRIMAVKKVAKDSIDVINDAAEREEIARIRIEGISRGAAKAGSSSVSEELQAMDRLRGVAIELARTVAARDAGVHLGPLTDSLGELQAVEKTLQAHLEVLSKEVDTIRYDRDVHYERYTLLMEDSVTRRVRNGLNILRTILTRVRTRQRVAKFEVGGDNIELEVLRLKLRQQQMLAEAGSAAWE